eukprot:4558649-Alexandrium_andersonii.AAC.1
MVPLESVGMVSNLCQVRALGKDTALSGNAGSATPSVPNVGCSVTSRPPRRRPPWRRFRPAR